MDLSTSAAVALRNLRRTRVQSSLAVLGVIIGVAAVVAVVSVGNGARANVEKTLASLDANQLEIVAEPAGQWRPGVKWKVEAGAGLTADDYLAIRRTIPGISAATLRAYAAVGQSASNDGPGLIVLGIDTQGIEVLGRALRRGTGFGTLDVLNAAPVCVISEFLAHAVFGDNEPIGKTLQIGNNAFTVIGVLTDDHRLSESSVDTAVFVPYTAVLLRIDRDPKVSIVVRAWQPRDLGEIQLAVSDLLEQRRGDRTAKFVSANIAEVVQRQRDASRTLTLLLGSIGGISLLVGGIGIMNVMLVNVRERTREIGIRMALGTRTVDVLIQFLMESTLLSLCGGVIGVAAGVGVARVIAYVSNWPTLITPDAIAVALVCSVGCGVFFGYYPAKRAAELDPINALHCD